MNFLRIVFWIICSCLQELDDDDDDDDDEEEIDEDDDKDGDDDDDETETKAEQPTITNLTEICPNVPWLKILNGVSGNSSQFENSSAVYFKEGIMKKYCTKLDSLLNKTKPE